MNVFVSQSLFKISLGRMIPGLIPLIALNVLALLVITYWPDLTLLLPRLFMG